MTLSPRSGPPQPPLAIEAEPAATGEDLDQAAQELGMGGDLAPEADQDGYRRRMARRLEVQQQRVGERWWRWRGGCQSACGW